MKINELRVGNYINFWGIHRGQLEHITENECFIKSYLGSVGVLYNDLRPLDVTSEVLINCGFKRVASSYFEIYNNNFGFELKLYPDLNYRLSLTKTGSNGYAGPIILLGIYKDFHNLQNIISLISQKELTLTL